jgi:hypothetical protein
MVLYHNMLVQHHYFIWALDTLAGTAFRRKLIFRQCNHKLRDLRSRLGQNKKPTDVSSWVSIS